MRLLLHLTLGIGIVAWQILFAAAVAQAIRPISGVRQLRTRQESMGTTDVQWDSTSFIVKGQRVYGWSAEFHFWRLPVSVHVFSSCGLDYWRANAPRRYLIYGVTSSRYYISRYSIQLN